jgi:hypothetical protein
MTNVVPVIANSIFCHFLYSFLVIGLLLVLNPPLALLIVSLSGEAVAVAACTDDDDDDTVADVSVGFKVAGLIVSLIAFLGCFGTFARVANVLKNRDGDKDGDEGSSLNIFCEGRSLKSGFATGSMIGYH